MAPMETNATRPARASADRRLCNRVALDIITRCGGVHFFGSVSVRMPSHSQRVGRWRFSGLAFHRPERSASFSSARPRRVSLCLRVSQSRRE